MTTKHCRRAIPKRRNAPAYLVSAASLCLPASAVCAQHEGHDMSKMPGPGHSKAPQMAPASPQSAMQSMMQDVKELRSLQGNDRERAYLTKMMDHHQSGIDMAKLALQKSQNSVIKKESQRIISDQTKEIAQMRQYLAQTHRINRSAKPDPRMQPMMAKLAGMSGMAFDRSFVQEMSMHHQGAFDMSQVVATGGVPHGQVKALAAKIIQGNHKSQQNLKKAVS